MDAAVPMDTLDADAANAAAVAAAAGPSGRAAVAVPPPRRERSKRIKRGEKQAEKKKKKEQESERLKAERAERLKAEEAATKAATREAKEAAREARKSARDMRPPQPRAKKGKGTLGQDARPAAVSPVPSPSRLRAQTGTTFAFGWEGDGIIKHGRGGRARSEDSDQGYVSTYYHGFSRKLQRGGTEELFQVGDSVQLYGAEQHADIQLAVLQDMFEDCLGTMWARLNWYYLPTEVPEAALNIAEGGVARGNEIFRSNHLDDVEVSCIQAKIVVRGLTPEEQAAGKPSEDRGAAQRSASAGYVLWRSFDVYKKRVHQIGEEGADSDDEGDSDADGMFSSESESEEEDRGTRDGEWDFAEARNHEAHDKKHSKRPAIQQQRGNHAFMLPTTRVAPSPDARQLSPDGSPLGDMETLSVFARAREVLRPGALPASMPCREREREEVGDFLRQSLQLGGVGRGLYVSGVPGTGKTATVYEVVRSLREEWEANEIPQFRFVEINGMSLPDPAYAFSVLHEEVTGRYCSPQKAADNLDKYWSSYSEQRACTVLLLDEVDLLVTRKQNVLYKLLDWPTYPFARLIVVAIANTMDLPERLLPRLGSRLGLQRVSFKPYDQEDIRKIVAARLGSLAAFNTDAIEICARKVASVSGDVRRALQICRRASEVAEERCNWEVESRVESPDPRSPSADGENKIQVEIEDVLAAVRDMSNKSNQENITELPLHGRLVLCILANQNQRTPPSPPPPQALYYASGAMRLKRAYLGI